MDNRYKKDKHDNMDNKYKRYKRDNLRSVDHILRQIHYVTTYNVYNIISVGD